MNKIVSKWFSVSSSTGETEKSQGTKSGEQSEGGMADMFFLGQKFHGEKESVR
jgi:hypothetical protein